MPYANCHAWTLSCWLLSRAISTSALTLRSSTVHHQHAARVSCRHEIGVPECEGMKLYSIRGSARPYRCSGCTRFLHHPCTAAPFFIPCSPLTGADRTLFRPSTDLMTAACPVPVCPPAAMPPCMTALLPSCPPAGTSTHRPPAPPAALAQAQKTPSAVACATLAQPAGPVSAGPAPLLKREVQMVLYVGLLVRTHS
jgi:hypothetical protein